MALPQVLRRAVLLCWCRRLDAVLFVGTGQIETSTRSTSEVLLCHPLSILLRSSSALNTVEGLSTLSVGNESDEGLFRTVTSEFHVEELVADKFRAAADEFQGEEFLICDLCEFVLVESFRENWSSPHIHTACSCPLYFVSVCSDVFLRHAESTTKFRCLFQSFVSPPFLLLSPDTLFQPGVSLDCSPLCLSVVSFLEVFKR